MRIACLLTTLVLSHVAVAGELVYTYELHSIRCGYILEAQKESAFPLPTTARSVEYFLKRLEGHQRIIETIQGEQRVTLLDDESDVQSEDPDRQVRIIFGLDSKNHPYLRIRWRFHAGLAVIENVLPVKFIEGSWEGFESGGAVILAPTPEGLSWLLEQIETPFINLKEEVLNDRARPVVRQILRGKPFRFLDPTVQVNYTEQPTIILEKNTSRYNSGVLVIRISVTAQETQ
ncbi:MAG: hypothetical protein HY537_13410 [Deltaproteobacteria bacterium]|nr:hypothetical protein [Deltaproteobacteria bacterium]